MSFLRLALRNHFPRTNLQITLLPPAITNQTTTFIRTTPQLVLPPHRHYATKGKMKSTAEFVPGSKQPITDEIALAEYNKADGSMKAAVDWFRKECQGFETRASGRVTPALLSPVRVKLEDREYKLEEVATVGVRDGSVLMVTLFEEKNMKVVESALYASKIPGIVVHKHDDRTIKIPIPKPTIEARKELYATAKRKAEEIRVQLRNQHQTSLKRGKIAKRSVEHDEFQKLADRHVADVDTILASLQKVTGASK